MDTDAVQKVLDQNPFLPLRLRTVDGGTYRILLPGEISLLGHPNRRFVVLSDSTQISLDSVESVELESAAEEYRAGASGLGPEMTMEKFDEFLKRRPFVPFTVHVADGDSFAVKGPEFASRTQGGRTIFVSTGGENTEWIDLLLVTRISSGVNNPSVSVKKD